MQGCSSCEKAGSGGSDFHVVDECNGIGELMFGKSLSQRTSDHAATCARSLERHVHGLSVLIEDIYGTDNSALALSEGLRNIARSHGGSLTGVACMQAIVLYAMHNEEEVGDYFESREHPQSDKWTMSLCRTLRDKVLPTMVPTFANELFDDCGLFVDRCMCLATMFHAELPTTEELAKQRRNAGLDTFVALGSSKTQQQQQQQ